MSGLLGIIFCFSVLLGKTVLPNKNDLDEQKFRYHFQRSFIADKVQQFAFILVDSCIWDWKLMLSASYSILGQEILSHLLSHSSCRLRISMYGQHKVEIKVAFFFPLHKHDQGGKYGSNYLQMQIVVASLACRCFKRFLPSSRCAKALLMVWPVCGFSVSAEKLALCFCKCGFQRIVPHYKTRVFGTVMKLTA